MKVILVNPNEVITSNWNFLHSKSAFNKYLNLHKSKKSQIITPVPLTPINLIENHFNDKQKKSFNNFKQTHKEAKYFLLDGSHRTTAADITNNKIRAILIEKDKDIEEALKMKKEGKIKTWRLGHNINKIIKELLSHFNSKPGFQTVSEKTKALSLHL